MIFSYICLDSWFRDISQIKIFDSDENNISLYYIETKEELKSLPYEAIQKILSAIKQYEKIFEFSSDEIEKLIREHFLSKREIILDGTPESIYFSDGIREIELSIDNIGEVDNPESEKLNLLLNLMNEIGFILSQYGIEKKYFYF